MVRILVLGATGHLGQAVVRRALESGHAVTAVSRQPDPIALHGLDVTRVRLDDGYGALKEIAPGQDVTTHDVLVDAAAPYPLDPCLPGSHAWRQAVDGAVAGTRQVLDAARRNRLKLVFVSSFTTLPRWESPLRAMETAMRRSMCPYFEAKAAMEREVMAAAREGLPAVIVNPAAFLGPWEFRNEESSFVRLVLAGRMPAVMDHVLSVIDVRDVAEAIECALAREMFGRPIALAGHNVSLLEVARQICALDDERALRPAALDPRVASLAAFWTSAAFAAAGRTAPDPWRAVPLAADGFPMRPSTEQIAMGLDLRPLSATLRDAIAFHRNGHFGGGHCGSSDGRSV